MYTNNTCIEKQQFLNKIDLFLICNNNYTNRMSCFSYMHNDYEYMFGTYYILTFFTSRYYKI